MHKSVSRRCADAWVCFCPGSKPHTLLVLGDSFGRLVTVGQIAAYVGATESLQVHGEMEVRSDNSFEEGPCVGAVSVGWLSLCWNQIAGVSARSPPVCGAVSTDYAHDSRPPVSACGSDLNR